MAWLTKYRIGRLAGGLSKRELREVVLKIAERLSQADNKTIRFVMEPKREAKTNDDFLKNAIIDAVNQNDGQMTVDELFGLLNNQHGLSFKTFYSRETPKDRKRALY